MAPAASSWVQPRSLRAWYTLWATTWWTVRALARGRRPDDRATTPTVDQNADLVSIPVVCENADPFCIRSASVLDDLPPFLTVEQAAKELQLGRSKAYELTVEWERTGGRSGLAVRVVRPPEADPDELVDPSRRVHTWSTAGGLTSGRRGRRRNRTRHRRLVARAGGASLTAPGGVGRAPGRRPRRRVARRPAGGIHLGAAGGGTPRRRSRNGGVGVARLASNAGSSNSSSMPGGVAASVWPCTRCYCQLGSRWLHHRVGNGRTRLLRARSMRIRRRGPCRGRQDHRVKPASKPIEQGTLDLGLGAR